MQYTHNKTTSNDLLYYCKQCYAFSLLILCLYLFGVSLAVLHCTKPTPYYAKTRSARKNHPKRTLTLLGKNWKLWHVRGRRFCPIFDFFHGKKVLSYFRFFSWIPYAYVVNSASNKKTAKNKITNIFWSKHDIDKNSPTNSSTTQTSLQIPGRRHFAVLPFAPT